MASDGDTIFKIIIGIVIGIFLIKAFEKEPTTTTASLSLESLDKQCCKKTGAPTDLLSRWKALDHNIPTVQDIMSGKYKPSQYPIALLSTGTDEISETSESGTEQGATTYSNDEKWIVKRDSKTGRIVGYDIDRKANITK